MTLTPRYLKTLRKMKSFVIPTALLRSRWRGRCHQPWVLEGERLGPEIVHGRVESGTKAEAGPQSLEGKAERPHPAQVAQGLFCREPWLHSHNGRARETTENCGDSHVRKCQLCLPGE